MLLGWRSREPVLGSNAGLVVAGGLFRPFALVDDRAVATWRLAGEKVELEPFTRLPRSVRAALAEDAEAVVRYLDPHAERDSSR